MSLCARAELCYFQQSQHYRISWVSMQQITGSAMRLFSRRHTHTHTRLTAHCPRLPGWAGTRKEKPIWILLKQETVSGSGISWAICKSAPRSRQINMPVPHNSIFYWPDALLAAQPTVSKYWRQFSRRHGCYTWKILNIWILCILHTHILTTLCPGLPWWAGTRNVKPVWILLKQETVSGSGISWAMYMSAPRCRQITTQAPHHSVFYMPDALPAAQPTASMHWRHILHSVENILRRMCC